MVRRDELEVGFSDIKSEERNGTAIVEAMAADVEELLTRRAHAADLIMRKAEELARSHPDPYPGYAFDRSIVSIAPSILLHPASLHIHLFTVTNPSKVPIH